MGPATAVSLDENLPDLKRLEALGRLVADLVAGERRVLRRRYAGTAGS